MGIDRGNLSTYGILLKALDKKPSKLDEKLKLYTFQICEISEFGPIFEIKYQFVFMTH
jgi:hypothetical protein